MTKSASPIIPNIVVCLSGEPKTGKTHFALTFPEPLVIFSFDLGLPPLLRKPQFSGKKLEVFEYPLPIIDSVKATGQRKELKIIWDKFMDDIKKTSENSNVGTVIIDTFTMAYQIATAARASELGLQQLWTEDGAVLYGDVYARLKAIIQRNRIAGKNIVLTHYLKDKYIKGEATGERILQGWSGVEGEADVVLVNTRRTDTSEDSKTHKIQKVNKIITLVKDCRFELQLMGQELENATYDDLVAILGLEAM